MIALLEDRLTPIHALCRQFGVRKLEVFGSGARGNFDPETSDLDFVIEFVDYGPYIAGRFFGFSEAMERLFSRRVDFIFGPNIKNPYLREAVNESKALVYESGGDQIAA